MALKTSAVHRKLDSKIKIMGLDAHDLLFVLLFASIMNIFFGQTIFSALMVFIVPILMAVILYFTKRNKPENFLLHYLKFFLLPKYLSSGDDGGDEIIRRTKFYD